jgi:hypothetical protein
MRRGKISFSQSAFLLPLPPNEFHHSTARTTRQCTHINLCHLLASATIRHFNVKPIHFPIDLTNYPRTKETILSHLPILTTLADNSPFSSNYTLISSPYSCHWFKLQCYYIFINNIIAIT